MDFASHALAIGNQKQKQQQQQQLLNRLKCENNVH